MDTIIRLVDYTLEPISQNEASNMHNRNLFRRRIPPPLPPIRKEKKKKEKKSLSPLRRRILSGMR